MSQESFLEVLAERAGKAAITVGAAEAGKLEEYWHLLAHWNRKINLTSLAVHLLPASLAEERSDDRRERRSERRSACGRRERRRARDASGGGAPRAHEQVVGVGPHDNAKDASDEAVDRLLVEPLVAAEHVPEGSLTWFDIGSGGGSPAIPMKIARPLARLTMVEARAKKAAFLREVVRSLELPEVSVIAGRFQDLVSDDGRLATADLITCRAVRLPVSLLQSIAMLLRPEGTTLLFGRRQPPDMPGRLFSLQGSFQLPSRASFLHVLTRKNTQAHAF